MDWSKFILKEGKKSLVSPCLEVVAFSFSPDVTTMGPGCDRFMRTFAKRYGSPLKFWRTGDMKGFRPFDKRTLDAPYHWFTDPKILSKKMLAFVAHSGAAAREFETPGLQLTLWGFDDPPFFIFKMLLPVKSVDKPDDVVAFVQDALADFPLSSGHCGYSFIRDRTSGNADIEKWMAGLHLQHPGLGYDNAVALTNAAHAGIAAVSWLTFLSPQMTEDLGGKEALKKKCPAGVSLAPLGKKGVLLRAGETPQLGDTDKKDRIPLYRAVGQLIKPCRASDEALANVAVDGIEDGQKWLGRFFD